MTQKKLIIKQGKLVFKDRFNELLDQIVVGFVEFHKHYFIIISLVISIIVIMVGDIKAELEACKQAGVAIIQQININSLQ
jgi:hypothetical protein